MTACTAAPFVRWREMTHLFDLACRPPWLVARFALPQRILSWSLNRPGLTEADSVAWLQVRDADLPPEVDPRELLDRRLAEQGLGEAVGLMTARDVRHHRRVFSGEDGLGVEALVTLGLTNGVGLDEAGRASDFTPLSPVGTINALIALSRPLSEGAMLEAISIAATARTAALLSGAGRIVGTGTDCLVIACPRRAADQAVFAGLHTAIGRQITTAVFQATRQARLDWEAGDGRDGD